ncbi:MAG: S-layer homology domain-containing protein [Clostridiales bacterium]|jgi:hypothetical protein|nr:S-layer homology domain-containing protein [Clostridiales bacterium]
MRLFVVVILFFTLFTTSAYAAKSARPVILGGPVISTFDKDYTSIEYTLDLSRKTDIGFTLFFHTSGNPTDITWDITFYAQNFFRQFSDSSDGLEENMSINEVAWNKDSLSLPAGNYSVKISVPESLFIKNSQPVDFLFEVVSNSTTGLTADRPSEWAEAEINAAIDSGVLPNDLKSNFTSNITRAEFAKLISYYTIKNISGAPGASITAMDEWLNDPNFYRLCGLEKRSYVFSDTNDKYVNFAYSVGIISGVGDGVFNPNGLITREQAAIMLARAAKSTNKGINLGDSPSFVDSAQFSPWAQEHISYITSVKTYDTGDAVMAGEDGGRFSPHKNYTREQGVVTVMRLMRATAQ